MTNLKAPGIIITFILLSLRLDQAVAGVCKSGEYSYGENSIADHLMTCSLSKLFDLDLTPQGEQIRSTARSLVDQGLSNKTTVLYSRLSGLWSAKRPDFVSTGWRCDEDKITTTSIIELSGLTLEVVERMDVTLHKNQHKLAIHRPCKTFDLPLWLCRQTKPVYRTIKTWVNKAYFNLTLSQYSSMEKPTVERLSLMFTCPETFKQRISHSPSAMYILSKYLPNAQPITINSNPRAMGAQATDQQPPLAHPVSYTSTQDGKGPTLPPYLSSVRLITHHVQERLTSAISDCIQLLDSDLTLLSDHSSFSSSRFQGIHAIKEEGDKRQGFRNECSKSSWLKHRMEIAEQAESLGQSPTKGPDVGKSHGKRARYLMKYPSDPSESLDPNGHYSVNADEMIDDN